MKNITQTKTVTPFSFFVFFVIYVNANVAIASTDLMQKRIDFDCQNNLQSCQNSEQFIKSKPRKVRYYKNQFLLIEFPQVLDLNLFRTQLRSASLSKNKQRLIVKRWLKKVSDDSLINFQPQLLELKKRELIIRKQPLTINNSLLLEVEPDALQQVVEIINQSSEPSPKYKTQEVPHLSNQSSSTDSNNLSGDGTSPLRDNDKTLQILGFTQPYTHKTVKNITIALVDSGVSTQHQELAHLKDFLQYNPKDNSYEVKDTGFGHGTGVLSLLASSNQHQRMISTMPKAQFLSCNGLPSGRYHYIWAVACYDWLLQQPNVDIAINSWLQPELTCNDELLYSLRALWLANTIPLFSAGNFGKDKLTSRDPVNFRLFDDVPLVSVGAITDHLEPYVDSSFGDDLCGNGVKSPTISTIGVELIAAHPFKKDSYQIVNGTSYSVALVAASVARLIEQRPELPNDVIIRTLLDSADTVGSPAAPIKTMNLKQSQKNLLRNNN